MALLFPKKQRAVLGVDLNAASVNLVELSRRKTGFYLKGFAKIPLPPDAIVAHTIQDSAAVSAALKLALTEVQTSTTHAAIALPATLVISKTLQVDATLRDEELEAYMQLEVAASIPYPVDEVYRDFCVLGLDEKDLSKATILLVAARRQSVDSRIRVLKDAGLHVAYVEVQSFVLERMVNYLNSLQFMGKTIAVVEINAPTVTFNVVHNGYAIYSREEPGINLGALEIESLLPLLRRFIQWFLSSGYSESIDKILFMDAKGYLADGYDRMTESLSIPCTVMDPFQNMPLSISPLPLPVVKSSLSIACGLALRGIHDGD